MKKWFLILAMAILATTITPVTQVHAAQGQGQAKVPAKNIKKHKKGGKKHHKKHHKKKKK